MPQGHPIAGVKIFIAIAMVASLVACVSDALLLYTPDAIYHTMDFEFFMDISETRLLIGQYLGICSIPFCLMGFWWLSRGLSPWNDNAPWYAFALMMVAMFLGVAYHSSLPLVAIQVKNLGGIEFVSSFFVPLGNIFAGLYFLLSLSFLFIILFREDSFPALDGLVQSDLGLPHCHRLLHLASAYWKPLIGGRIQFGKSDFTGWFTLGKLGSGKFILPGRPLIT